MGDKALVFTVDGKRHELNLEEITGRDAKEFRTTTGTAFRRAVTMFVTAPDDVDIDIIAGIIWLARRQAGETVDYDAVLESVNYGTDFAAVAEEVEPPEV